MNMSQLKFITTAAVLLTGVALVTIALVVLCNGLLENTVAPTVETIIGAP